MKQFLILMLILEITQVSVAEVRLTASDGSSFDRFGISTSIDGDTAVIGALGDESAYVFVRTAGVWIEQQKLTALDASAGDFFGDRVAVSGDTVLVSAQADDDLGDESGSVYVFTRTAGVWTEQQKLTASDGAEGDLFGTDVSVDGDTAVVGAMFDDDFGESSGSAYVFVRTAGVWTEQQKLTASDGAEGDSFGISVGLSGDTAIIGAFFDNDLGDASGSAYVFTRVAGVWTEQQKLTATDGATYDLFGVRVAVSRDTTLVSAREDDDMGASSGSAYVFVRTAGAWTQQAKLTASDGAELDQFGGEIALDGGMAVIGASGDDDAGARSGSAYVFIRKAGGWSEEEKLTASDAAAGDEYGRVALSGSLVVVGAFKVDEPAENDVGAAYVYMIPVFADGFESGDTSRWSATVGD